MMLRKIKHASFLTLGGLTVPFAVANASLNGAFNSPTYSSAGVTGGGSSVRINATGQIVSTAASNYGYMSGNNYNGNAMASLSDMHARIIERVGDVDQRGWGRITHATPSDSGAGDGCVAGAIRHDFDGTESRGSGAVEGVYSVEVKVSPFDNFVGSLHSQTTNVVLTPLGQYIEANKGLIAQMVAGDKSGAFDEGSNYRTTWEAFLNGAQNAAAQGVQDIPLNISDANKKGLSKGGGIRVSENLKRVSIASSHWQDKYLEYHCVTEIRQGQGHYISHGEYPPMSGDPDEQLTYTDSWTETYSYPVTIWKYVDRVSIDGNYTQSNVTPIIGAPYESKSWTHRTVRCNTGAFTSSTGGNELVTGNKDFYFSPGQCQDGPNAVFKCYVDPLHGKGMSGEIQKNKAASHKKDDKSGKFGAYAEDEKIVGQSFQFFRDNKSHPIRLDVWFPTSTDSRVELAPSPTRTLITLSKTGTPGKLFVLEDANKNTLANGEEINSGKNTFDFAGTANLFYWKSSWASDLGFPHGMNSEFAYKPKIRATVPSQVNQHRITGTEDISTVIDVSCQSHYSTLESKSIVKNRPEEISNYRTEIKTTFDNSDSKALKVSFAKSSSDH